MKKRCFIFFAVMACTSANLVAVGQTKWKSIGVELQVYPAGIMPGLTADYQFTKSSFLTLRTGMNLANRYDWSGLNDSEKGMGAGVTIGYRHYIKEQNWYIGGRTDFWWMNINWKDSLDFPQTGSTQIGILQPTAEFGYTWRFGGYNLSLGTAQGFEINIITKGRAVGEGRVSLLQLICTKNI